MANRRSSLIEAIYVEDEAEAAAPETANPVELETCLSQPAPPKVGMKLA